MYFIVGPKTCEQVHYGLQWAFGSASAHLCVTGCGEQARHWAYQYTAKHELVSAEGTRYSEDFNDYAPMCWSCHRSFDLQADPRLKDVARTNISKGRARVQQLLEEDPDFREYRVLNMQRLNRQRLRRCKGCTLESNPGAIGYHQKISGHVGWEAVNAG